MEPNNLEFTPVIIAVLKAKSRLVTVGAEYKSAPSPRVDVTLSTHTSLNVTY